MPTDATPIDPLLARLIALAPLKTWSVIVTVFGDLTEDQVSGKALGALLAPIGIKPEAIRVALHRLRRDGWVISERSGREMIHSLSPRARTETDAVFARVYGQQPPWPEGWRLILDLQEGAPHTDKITLARNIALVPKTADLPPEAMAVLAEAAYSDWFEDRLIPGPTRRQAAELAELAQNAAHSSSVRLLLLHQWRRLALRTETWAHIDLFPEGPLSLCHRHVTGYLARHPRLSLPD